LLTAFDTSKTQCIAWHTNKEQKPFTCPQCEEEVILKKGIKKVHHFAHKPPVNCNFGAGESQKHYEVKKAIYEALLKEPNCSKCELERTKLEGVRPDISLKINDSYVAIEIQNSTIDIALINQRIERYNKLNIHLIWILPDNNPTIVLPDSKDEGIHKKLCRPKEWEKYLHQLYFGRLYYWQDNANVKPLHLKTYQYETVSGNWVEECSDLEGTNWYNENVDMSDYGGYTKYSKTKKEFIFPKLSGTDIILNIAKDFKATEKEKSTFNGSSTPHRKLWIDNIKAWWK
jgi:competence protein CoiA